MTGAMLDIHASGVDDSFEARLDFGDDASGFVSASMKEDLPAVLDASIRLIGERGDLIVENPLAPQLGHRLTVQVVGEDMDTTVDGGTTYEHQLRHFVELVNGRVDPLLTAGDPAAQMKVLDAIRRYGESSAS